MKKGFKSSSILTSFLICTLLFLSCRSAPQREMKITLIHSTASEMLESANSCILSGEYENANFFLAQAYTQAMTIDNYELLTSVCLGYVSLNLSYNPPYTQLANDYLTKARVFAKYAENVQKEEALCALAEVRIKITDTNQPVDYRALINLLDENEKHIRGDKYFEAQFASAYGDIYRTQKNYDAAEKEYETAAKLYTDNRYLSEIGITWYKIAQVSSLNNKKTDALKAMEKAIFYDRSAENTLALGTDYYIKGIILLKGNPTAAEKDQAKYAFEHSAEIFTAAGKGMEDLAKRSLDAAAEL